MSGLELQAKLNAEHCRIPTNLHHGTRRHKMRMQALRAGAAEFLAKPFDDESLLGSVRAALESLSPIRKSAHTRQEVLCGSYRNIRDW